MTNPARTVLSTVSFIKIREPSQRNWENNRESFEIRSGITEFCRKPANYASTQGLVWISPQRRMGNAPTAIYQETPELIGELSGNFHVIATFFEGCFPILA